MIHCLILQGRGLDDEMRTTLTLKALAMAYDRRERASLKGRGMEGEIRTDFRYSSLGTYSGMVFTADIETDLGKTHVRYIVRTRDVDALYEALDKGETEWVTLREVMETVRGWHEGDAGADSDEDLPN